MDPITTLETALELLQGTAGAVEELAADGTGIDKAARAAELLLQITANAVKAHRKITGTPIDLSKLHELSAV